LATVATESLSTGTRLDFFPADSIAGELVAKIVAFGDRLPHCLRLIEACDQVVQVDGL